MVTPQCLVFWPSHLSCPDSISRSVVDPYSDKPKRHKCSATLFWLSLQSPGELQIVVERKWFLRIGSLLHRLVHSAEDLGHPKFPVAHSEFCRFIARD